jgi:GH43 family beta-xylosidase
MKKLLIMLLALSIALSFVLSSCADSAQTPSEPDTDTAPGDGVTDGTQNGETDTEEDEEKKNMISVGKSGKKSKFKIIIDALEDVMLADYLKDLAACTSGVSFNTGYDRASQSGSEIVITSVKREAFAELEESLAVDEYAIKAVKNDLGVQIFIAANGSAAKYCALDRFINDFTTENGIEIPEELDVRGKFSYSDLVIEAQGVDYLRDPCILVENGVYYMYGTRWLGYKNTSGSLLGEWTPLGQVAEAPSDYADNPWAPEVHKYGGKYYMFTTYKSTVTGKRGSVIMFADSPEGPFKTITNGQITPSEWDCIDGTLYVDEAGDPWLIFVREWVSAPGNIGTMAIARLSDDLTCLISEPVEIFKATDPDWTAHSVTDGCWTYKTESGELLMLWSNFTLSGYCVAVVKSDNGKIDGNWSHCARLLITKDQLGKYDGGHGMIFTDLDGQMYIAIHSPNTATADRTEKPIFVPIKEIGGSLSIDYSGLY